MLITVSYIKMSLPRVYRPRLLPLSSHLIARIAKNAWILSANPDYLVLAVKAAKTVEDSLRFLKSRIENTEFMASKAKFSKTNVEDIT